MYDKQCEHVDPLLANQQMIISILCAYVEPACTCMALHGYAFYSQPYKCCCKYTRHAGMSAGSVELSALIAALVWYVYRHAGYKLPVRFTVCQHNMYTSYTISFIIRRYNNYCQTTHLCQYWILRVYIRLVTYIQFRLNCRNC